MEPSGKQRGAGVENAVHRIGPILSGQDRIPGVPDKQWIVLGSSSFSQGKLNSNKTVVRRNQESARGNCG